MERWFNSTCDHRKRGQQPGFNTKDWTEFSSSKMTSVEREVRTLSVYFLGILCKWRSIFIGNHCLHCLYSFCIKIWITFVYFCMIDLTCRFQRTCLRAYLHGGGGPQVGEVTRLGGVARLSIQSLILMWSGLRVRWANPPHVTSPSWGPPPSCKQALGNYLLNCNQQLLKLKKKAFMQILIVAQNYPFKDSFDAFICLSVIWTGFLPNFVKF